MSRPRGKPELVGNPKTRQDVHATPLRKALTTCYHCGTGYLTAAQATACELWHEADEPETA